MERVGFMKKILMSACLCGEYCRYDGNTNLAADDDIVTRWMNEGRVVMVCPEMAGGLPVPRDPAEITGDQVISKAGNDVTFEYEKGAAEALRLADENDVAFAVMKENSPSCGSSNIYDGTFSGRKIPGKGKAAALLDKNGYRVYNEHQIKEAEEELKELENQR